MTGAPYPFVSCVDRRQPAHSRNVESTVNITPPFQTGVASGQPGSVGHDTTQSQVANPADSHPDAVQITAKMYECRDTARAVLGDKYAEYMRTYALGINAMAELKKLDPLPAMIELAKKCPDPHEAILVMAAYVEMTEPSSPEAAK